MLIDGLLAVAGWINTLVCAGAMLSLVAILSFAVGMRRFKVLGIDTDLSFFPLALVGLTIGHAYATWLFVRKCSLLLTEGGTTASDAWMALTNKGGLIFSEMHPRLLTDGIGPFDWSAYVISNADPAAWLTAAFAVVALMAVIITLSTVKVKRLTSMQTRLFSVLVGWTIGLANWLIGSQWAIAASSLS
jgi:hypothetical protein